MEKNKIMMIVIIVLLVVLLASVGVVSFFAVRMLSGNSESEEPTLKPEVILPIDKIWTYNLSDPIYSNLMAGEDGSNKHLINVSVTIGVNGSNIKDKEYTALIELIPEKEKYIASKILDVIRRRTYEELITPEGKEILEDDILVTLQEVFDTNLIVSVSLYGMILS